MKTFAEIVNESFVRIGVPNGAYFGFRFGSDEEPDRFELALEPVFTPGQFLLALYDRQQLIGDKLPIQAGGGPPAIAAATELWLSMAGGVFAAIAIAGDSDEDA